MPTIALNDRIALTLTCPPDKKEITWGDKTLRCFGVRCRDSGARTWRLQYRIKSGVTRKHDLGSPGIVRYAEAKGEAKRLLAIRRLGGDPAGEAKAAIAAAKAAISVGGLVDKYLARQRPRLRPGSYKETARNLLKHAAPLHQEPAARVTQRAIVELLEGVATRGPVAANRVRAALSGAFAWGMKAALVQANPVAATFKPAEERPRERVLSDHELPLIWGGTAGRADYDRIVRLLMLTGARREEIGGMRWSEVTLEDDGTATWLLPSGRSKNGVPHQLVLPRFATSILPAPRRADGTVREFVFGVGRGPFSGWSHCKARLNARIADSNGGEPIAPWVLHDLRRSFVTHLNDLGIEPHIVEALVNHGGGVARAGVAGTYNLAAYGPQKRAALALWSDHVAEITGEGRPDDDATSVVPLRKSRS